LRRSSPRRAIAIPWVQSLPHYIHHTIKADPTLMQIDTDTYSPQQSKNAPRGPLAAALVVFGLVLAGASLHLFGSVWESLAAYAVTGVLVFRGLAQSYPHAKLGLCNLITLIRATLVCFLFGAIFADTVSIWLVTGVATCAYALDAADGWLARRSGLVSGFGARFDMETDAALAAVICLWLISSGTAGWEVLVLGFTRYVFVLASAFLPALRGPLPPSTRRKLICAVQVGALILLVCPLTPGVLVPVLTIGASSLLLWSFGVDVIWLLRRADPRQADQTDHRMHGTALAGAALCLCLALVQPNHPAGVSWTALAPLSLEFPLLLLVLLTLGRTTLARPLRLIIVAGLLALSLLKTADFAMFAALNRGINPVGDLALAEAGFRLLSGAIGGFWSVVALFGLCLAFVALATALWWASGVWARAAPSRGMARMGFAAAACCSAGLAVADAGARTGLWDLPFDVPGTTRSTALALGKLDLAQATLEDLRDFEAAAANDPYAETNGLLDVIDRDVILVFLESYGRTSLDTPLYADLHRPTLAKGQKQLEALGVSTASGVLASPTRGGQSWLAHATFANGLWIDSDTRYRAVLASDRRTLFHVASDAGFHTAAVMPQITLDWPESSVMGFETILAMADLGYRGKNFNWVTMPDQFTYHAMDRLLRSPPRDRPLFIQVATGSSHAPWVPVPELVDWDSIGDGQIFNEMASSGDTPKEVWRDRDRVRAQYRLAIDYALQTVLSYAARLADDPPLIIIVGDHQSAGFVALDDRPDVPIHVIGPAHLVERVMHWGLTPGLLPPDDAPVLPMDRMRDLFLQAFSARAVHRHAER
jgi:phosphatidylglycerophosphate synthase